MRIEELVLEGFKSYPVRTQITGWDSSFNAITGLNGSGKSNILDAICFVLGITNMQQMRAQNQQDLIYKRGQAGITKASVTIVFDNSDRDKSPVGLENCKQITVTRQIALPNVSKYILNGHKTQQQTVQTLFQSVQLNINNPNFLIMQGRITKVLNMRPAEILGLVEEAAGTRMFEERKAKALKTMAKKASRVDSITSVLREEIVPKLDALRAERAALLLWRKACAEAERVGRVLRAWEWTEARERTTRKGAEIEKREREIARVKKDRERFIREGEAAERDAQEIQRRREDELRKGNKLKKGEEEVAELDKALVKIRTQVEIKNASIKDEDAKVSALQVELKELELALQTKRAHVADLTQAYTAVKEQQSATQGSLTTAEELLQSLLTGLSNTGGGGGYMGQLADSRARLAQAAAEEEQNKVKLAMAEKELAALQVRWRDVEREAGEGRKKIEKARAEVEGIRKKLAGCGWNEAQEKEMEQEVKNAKEDLKRLTEEQDAAKQKMSSLDFTYSMPSPNFDRGKVKGLVATLISLKPEDYNKSTALEITAGAKLYNVVVQDEHVGKELLQNGKLKKRVTLIPLNKISAFKMSAQRLQAATKLAPGKARLALSLVGYADEVANAMAFVFGDTLVCDDPASAQLVTFSAGVRCVTLDGDVYDPSGTLSGGAAPTGSGVLLRVQDLLRVEQRVKVARQKMQEVERQEAHAREARERWMTLVRDLEMKEHGMKLLEEQIGGSNANRTADDIERLKKTVADLQGSIQSAKEKQRKASDECKKLEKDMDEFKNNKEGKIEELKRSISKQKAALQKHAVVVKTQQKEQQTAMLDLEQMERDLEAGNTGVREAVEGVAKLHKELGKLQDQLRSSEDALAKAERKLREERATLTRFDDELNELEHAIKNKKQAVSDADLQLKKLEHDVQNLNKEKTAATNLVVNLESQHEWIQEEKESFGKPGTQYDFAAVDIGKMREKARELEESQKGMKKKVNPKVLTMIDSVEKKEASLKKMLATVLKDKEKIEATIEELDRYKRDALQKTWEKVNRDFGGIFAELLPGNFAKLQPPEGQDLMDGLEVKVQLGTVWKQSLTELSGGQRSLIALSLIMALLQFKPAPMYILDEIDAALDLSHTQHIGQLFRTRFKGSQFIVVSLKEGLFTNANVLFRTKFRDGTSIVERIAQRSSSTLYTAADVEDEDEGHGRRRKRT